MVTLRVGIETKGPLFTGQPGEVIERHLANAVRQLVELGEQRLDLMLRPRPAGVYLSVSEAGKNQASTGNYRRNVHGVASHLHGRITDGGVIYGPWLEGVSSRNVTTRFRGYSSFRRVGQSLQEDAHDVAERHIERAVKELNG